MGAVFSYYSEDYEKRMGVLESRIRRLEEDNKSIMYKLSNLERRIMKLEEPGFQFDEYTILRDPKKVSQMNTNNEIDSDLEKELKKFGTQEEIMKAKGFRTEEELNEYVDSHRIYSVSVCHDNLDYSTQFRNKKEYDAFRKRLDVWIGKGFH